MTPLTETTRPASTSIGQGRLSDAEALALYADCDLHELGRRAQAITQRLHPEDFRTYVVDRNINYANYCTA